MKLLANSLMCAVIALSATASFAQDAARPTQGMPKDSMPKDGMAKKEMTTDDCKAHMAAMKKDGVMKDGAGNVMNKDGTKRDEAMAKHDSMCAIMMKKDSMPAAPMKK